MSFNRIAFKSYAQSTVNYLKAEESKQKYDWQRELYRDRASENQRFVDRFESTAGESLQDISKASKSRGRAKVVTRALLGVAGAVALGAAATIAGPALGPIALMGAAISLVAGGATAHQGHDGEANFRHQLKGLSEDFEAGREPSITSGSIPQAPASSESDDLLNLANPASPLSFFNPASPLSVL